MSSQLVCVVEKDFEFNFAVTEDVGVGGATSAVFGQKMFKHVVPVLAGKISGVQRDIKLWQTAAASSRSVLLRYSVPSSSSQFFINRPST